MCMLMVQLARNFTSMPADNASHFNSSWLETVFEIVYDGNEFLGFYSEVDQGCDALTSLGRQKHAGWSRFGVPLVAPYCAIPRDYLSDTRAIPPPPFLSASP